MLALPFLALLVLLSGPDTILRGKVGDEHSGYDFGNFFSMSYTPHICVAGLLFVGIAGAVAVRLFTRKTDAPVLDTLPALVAPLAVLAITDETSAALLGASVGVAWLVHPETLGIGGGRGLGALAALAAALPGANYLFAASLAPGGPVAKWAWVAARAPGYYTGPAIPLTQELGRKILAFDVGPIVVTLAVLGYALALERTRRFMAGFTFLAFLAGVSLIGLTRVEINGIPLESHRFMTAASFVAALLGALCIRSVASTPAPMVVLLGALVLPAR